VVGAIESDSSATTTDTITQTAPSGYQTTVSASPSTITANGMSTSTVTATVTDSGTAVNDDPVTFSGASNETGACSAGIPAGAITTGTTGESQFTYTSTTSVGECVITAKESFGSSAGTATITQNAPGVQVAISPATANLTEGQSEALTVTVTNGGNPVANDVVTLSVPVSTCGQLSDTSSGLTTSNGHISVTTDDQGVATGATYTASDTAETCSISGIEADNSATGSATVTQTSSGAVVQEFAYPNSVPADGKSTSTVIATVTDNGVSVGAGADVFFTGTSTTAGACGVTSSVTETTNANGQAELTYTATDVPGVCVVKALDTGNDSGTVDITQTGAALSPETVTVSANPDTALLVLDTTATITASVTGAGGVAVPGTVVQFSMISSGLLDACGTLSAASGTTGANGQVAVTYTTPTVAPVLGSCTIVATVTSVSPSISGQTTIEEIIPVPIGTSLPTP
jgi:adhesin/invasin